MSWSSRYARRGGISLFEFLAELERLGFVEEWARPGHTYEFSHPAAGDRTFIVGSESFANALDRLRRELVDAEYEAQGAG
jgi:hypothetical protein